VNQNGEPVDFLDAIVSDGNAADRSAVAVKEDVSAGILMRPENAVGSIGITDVQAEEEIALRIEPVEIVEPFGNLLVAETAFGAENSR
jgi:hypothetical protein